MRLPLPPYGKTVAQTPLGYWERGTRVVVFAGPRAWRYAKPWLEDAEPLRARHRYTLVCPPGIEAVADTLRWPVADRVVVIVSCGTADYVPLISALQRDGCAGGEVLDIEGEDHLLGWEWRLMACQPWGFADFDGELVHAAAEQDRAGAEALFDAWVQRVTQAADGVAFVQACRRGSLGEEIARRLALRGSGEARH